MSVLSKIKHTITKEFLFYNDIVKNVILKRIDNRYINFNNSLEIFGVDKKLRCVYLGEENTSPVWALEIAKEGTDTVQIPNFEKIARNHTYKEESKLTLFYSKRPVGEDNFFKKESIYLFSYNRKLLADIAFEFDIDFMETDKIIQAFYDIGLINKYHINEESLALKSRFNFTSLPKDELNNLYFKSIFAEGVYGGIVDGENPQKRNYHLYQGIAMDGDYLASSPDLYKLFQEDWHGYIAMNIDLYNQAVSDTIADTNLVVQFGEKNEEIRKVYKNASDETIELANLSCICNIVALLDREDSINRIGSILNVQFIPKNIRAKNIIYGTPLLVKSSAYDFVAPIKNIGAWIKSIHKKHNIISRTAKQMYGRDISHNFINYSWSETGDSLHWAIVAPTRSGKTFTILKTIQSAIGATVEPKSEAEIIENETMMRKHGAVMATEKITSAKKLGKTKIVHFDTGNSGLSFVTELKRAYPSQVYLSKDNINNMRFGLLNIKYNEKREAIDDNDFLFSVSIMNLILHLNKSPQINGNELSELRKAITRVFFKDNYRGLTIKELENLGGYEDTIDAIYRHGEENGIEVTIRSRTTELGLRGTSLDYIQKPTMSALLKEVERKSDNYAVTAHEKDACASLFSKLKVIEEQPMFAYYDKNNIKECDYYYQELHELKELGDRYFLPAYMITIRRLYRRDVANAQRLKEQKKPVPAVIYVLEEVHNFINIDVLEKYYETITREASRYQIYFGFITQMPRDIPSAILANIGSRMVLSSNKVTKTDLSYYWASDTENKEEVQRLASFYSERKRKYLTFIHAGNGIVTIQQKVSKSEERLFNSNGEADLAEEIEDVA